jgi:hypothetical protein
MFNFRAVEKIKVSTVNKILLEKYGLSCVHFPLHPLALCPHRIERNTICFVKIL